MSVNRFRPSGWAALTRPESPSVAELVSGGRSAPTTRPRAATLAGSAARRGLSAVVTPAGERILHRIGYRRVAVVLVAASAAVVVPLGIAVTAAIVTAPATVPAAVSAAVLDQTAAVFGGGTGNDAAEQLAAAAVDGPVRCTRSAARFPALPAPHDGSSAAVPPGPAEIAPLAPVAVDSGGGLSTADAALLVDPVPPGTSALTANVWFLYRMAGLGDWPTFTAAYAAAGLLGDAETADAVLVQAQALNTVGAPIEGYRLTAAALTQAGMMAGRLSDPTSQFRQVLAVELVSGCVTDEDADAARVALPAPSTGSAKPVPSVGEQIPESGHPVWTDGSANAAGISQSESP